MFRNILSLLSIICGSERNLREIRCLSEFLLRKTFSMQRVRLSHRASAVLLGSYLGHSRAKEPAADGASAGAFGE